MSVPLTRPEPPTVDPIAWPGLVVSVFGPGADAFAEAFSGARPARVLETALRHRDGFSWDGTILHAHPDALIEGLTEAREDAEVTIGTGAAFAVGVRASLTVWIRGGAPLIALPSALRPLASGAHLVLEHARLGLARELASTLDRGLRTSS